MLLLYIFIIYSRDPHDLLHPVPGSEIFVLKDDDPA